MMMIIVLYIALRVFLCLFVLHVLVVEGDVLGGVELLLVEGLVVVVGEGLGGEVVVA